MTSLLSIISADRVALIVGAYIGLYALLLAGSNYLAPVFAGFINDGQGWEWVLVGHRLPSDSGL